jgi:colicin import membrane protein
MSMMNRNNETSVTFSLAELARIEEERVRNEDRDRARARERQAREKQEAEAQRRALEAARLAVEEEARARRAREEAEHRARIEARERAAIEVARIEAEAKARLDAQNAERAHELAVIRTRTEAGQRRTQRVLGAVLGIVLCSGAAGAFSASRQITGLTQDVEHLREGQQALAREREQAKATELSALDRRYAALGARAQIRAAEEARVTAEAARRAVDEKAPDRERLRAFGDALDALDARLDTLDRIAALDRRHADLVAWAGDQKHREIAGAQAAEQRAKGAGAGESAVQAYETALDQLREALARGAVATGPRRRTQTETGNTGWSCTDPNDPMCGLNGRPL